MKKFRLADLKKLINVRQKLEMITMLAGQENLRKMVREEVEKVIRASGLLIKYREISDEEAGKEIAELIIRLKAAGNKKISALDIVSFLVLPPEQVEKILEKFEQTGRLSEFNE